MKQQEELEAKYSAKSTFCMLELLISLLVAIGMHGTMCLTGEVIGQIAS